ncbi:hypothetical protein Rcae01_02250 [Novipirellula caenicola]|uniref:Non-specific protein-tyrosine kinase n=2 Tax=Novipirellula caenicola TaxID=1536901 RepID=A0ABP9VSP3_9BACT
MLRRSPLVETYKTELAPPPPPDDALLQIDDLVLYFRFVLRHKYRILLSLLYAFVGGWIYYQNHPVVYRSKAKVLVQPKNVIGPDGYSIPERDASLFATHASLIQSPWFVEKAIQENELQGLNLLAESSSIANTLLPLVNVDHKDSIVQISFDSVHAEECPQVLAALVQTYEDYLVDSRRENMEQAIALIHKKAESLQQQLQRQKLAHQTAKATVPLPAIENAEYATFSQQLREIDNRRVDASVQRAAALSRLATIKAARSQSIQAASLLLPAIYLERQMHLESSDLHRIERREDLAEQSRWRGESKQLQAHERLLEARIRLQGLKERLGKQLFPLIEEEKLLSNQYGDNYPSLQELRKKISQIRDLYTEQIESVEKEIAIERRLVDESLASASVPDNGNPASTNDAAESMESNESRLSELIDAYIGSLEQELADLDATDLTLAAQYQTMTRQMEQHRGKVRESELYQSEHDHLMNEIGLTERRYDALVSQLSQFDLNKDYGNFRTTVISPPSTPSQIAPNALIIALTSGMIGFFCAFVWVGCAEIAERTFHNPEAIRDLGLPILAKIPERNRDRKRFQPRLPQTLCTVHEPESADAEAYRSVRTALDCINHTGTNMVIQVTSPMAGDGKSTLAANLAVSIAQSGKRVLLMDTNFRTPTMHDLFSNANHVGLSTLLSGQSTPRDVIHEVNTAGLYLLTAGPLPKSPADLIALPRFARFVDWLRDRFQFVIIDTPPILLASESRVISALSDGVLLTIRSHHSDPTKTQQACELLDIAGANVLGVVVNETTCTKCRRRSFEPPQIMTTSPVTTVTKRRIH